MSRAQIRTVGIFLGGNLIMKWNSVVVRSCLCKQKGEGCFCFGKWQSSLVMKPKPGLEGSVCDSGFWPNQSRKGAYRQWNGTIFTFNNGLFQQRRGKPALWTYWRLSISVSARESYKRTHEIIWTTCWLWKVELLWTVILTFVNP